MGNRRLAWIPLLGVVLLVALSTTATRANDATDLQAKIRGALRAAKSFVVTVNVKPGAGAPTGGTIVYTVVAPNRFRQEVSGSIGSDDTIVIGNQVYGHDNGAWDVQTWSDHLVTGYESSAFLVDVTSADGSDFTMRFPHEGPDQQTLTCTYDPQTFRPQNCTGQEMTIAYTRYDDPTVTIPTPANAKRENR